MGCRKGCHCSRRCWASSLKKNALVIALMFSVGIGICMGVGLRYKGSPWTSRELLYLRFPGELFLRMLKMVILPLVVASIVTAVSSLSTKTAGKIGGKAVVYYLATTFASVILGIILVVSIRPGGRGRINEASGSEKIVSGVDSLLDLIRNCFPSNIVSAAFSKAVTVITKPTMPPSDTSNTTELPAMQWKASVTEQSGSNILGLIVFSIAFGIAINRLGDEGTAIREFFSGLGQAMIVMVRIIIWYSPIGIIFLIAEKVVGMTNPIETLTQLGLYMATVICGLAIHMFITLPLLYFLIVRKNPFAFMLGMSEALVCAVSTASSSATLPVTLHCAEDINHIDKRITRFMIPLGSVINMDGTALYEAVASIFLAQYRNISLSFGQIVIVCLTSTAAAIGAAGIPQAGLVTMMIVLEAIGLPSTDIWLIYAIDWFLDRLRTSLNVWGDAIGAGIVEKLSLADLRRMDEEEFDEPPPFVNPTYMPDEDGQPEERDLPPQP